MLYTSLSHQGMLYIIAKLLVLAIAVFVWLSVKYYTPIT